MGLCGGDCQASVRVIPLCSAYFGHRKNMRKPRCLGVHDADLMVLILGVLGHDQRSSCPKLVMKPSFPNLHPECFNCGKRNGTSHVASCWVQPLKGHRHDVQRASCHSFSFPEVPLNFTASLPRLSNLRLLPPRHTKTPNRDPPAGCHPRRGVTRRHAGPCRSRTFMATSSGPRRRPSPRGPMSPSLSPNRRSSGDRGPTGRCSAKHGGWVRCREIGTRFRTKALLLTSLYLIDLLWLFNCSRFFSIETSPTSI